MEQNEMVCPICGEIIKRGNGYHTKNCVQNYVDTLTDERKQELVDLYNSGYSMVDMSEVLGFKYSLTEKILKHLGIKRRSVKDATSQKRCRKKYTDTCMERFGTPHNFSKECISRKKWEKRLFDEEGITNVFQRESVKQKIKNTLLERYGEEGVLYNYQKGSFIEYYIEKYGEEKGREYFEWVRKRKREVNYKEYYIEKYGDDWEEKWRDHIIKISKSHGNNYGLNDKCEELLKKLNIKYDREFSLLSDLYNYVFDFKINNLILELNGIYWHCSPKKYKPNDLVKFPGNHFIKAKDKWEYDRIKCEFAESLGYKVITIWEDEFSEDLLVQILNENKNETCKN